MTFHRLLEDPEDDFESALLRSASLDVPSDAQVRRGVLSIAALGGALSASAVAAAGATPALGTASTQGTFSAALFAKWMGIGLVAGLVTTGGGVVVAHRLAPAAAVLTEGSVVTNRAVAEPPIALGQRTAAVEVEPVEPRSARLGGGLQKAKSATAAPRTRAHLPNIQRQEERATSPAQALPLGGTDAPANISAQEPRPPAMAAEIAALSRARLALSARAPDEVLATLDGYDRSERTHVLDAEATMLRLEALMQLGRNEEAFRLARKALIANPGSPHRARLTEIINTR